MERPCRPAATLVLNWLLRLSLISFTCATRRPSSVGGGCVNGSRSFRDAPIAAAQLQKPRVDVDNRKRPFVMTGFLGDRWVKHVNSYGVFRRRQTHLSGHSVVRCMWEYSGYVQRIGELYSCHFDHRGQIISPSDPDAINSLKTLSASIKEGLRVQREIHLL